jgi:hypothetical protein
LGRKILQTIGSNLLLKDKKLLIDLPKPYKLIEEQKNEVDKTLKMLEPQKEIDIKTQIYQLYASNPRLSLVED